MRRKTLAVGGIRASALWGTGGEGSRRAGAVLAVALAAVVLCLPVSAGALSLGSGSPQDSAVVPESLLDAATAHPDQTFSVIVQASDGTTSADVAGAVSDTSQANRVKRKFD